MTSEQHCLLLFCFHRRLIMSSAKNKTTSATIHTVPKRAAEKAPQTAANAEARARVAHALSTFLASTYALYQKSLFYHWNVTGPHFVGLHGLFEEHYNALHQAGDEVAERIRALGHFAPGTMAEFASLSRIAEDRRLPQSAEEMVANLLQAHEECSSQAREVQEIAEKADDSVTADMMVARMGYHDKAAWMLRAWRQ
jgi:starvation-inducible DNA-binding protein